MATFNGVLKSNEIFAGLFNMIINQQVFGDNISGLYSDLVDMSRVDGSLYGDTKLYYSTDVLKSSPWGGDAEAANLLNIYRPDDPKVQAIHLDKFRQICLTVDNYLSKRAWSTEGAFSSFNSVMLGWIRETKRIYETTLFNTFVGTTESSVGKQSVNITLPVVSGDTEATMKEQGAAIATKIADILVELQDVTRDYNDYGHLRSFSPDSIVAVWNSEHLNKIKKYTLPVLFNKEGFIDKLGQKVLPAKYFGTVNKTSGTTQSSNTKTRALDEDIYGSKHLFASELLDGSVAYQANETYNQDDKIICKLFHVRSIPFMSAFEIGTSFNNPKSLTETFILTWGHNTLEYLKNYPFITVRGTTSS